MLLLMVVEVVAIFCCWFGTFWSFAAVLLPGAESESLLLSKLIYEKYLVESFALL
jgi:hypothetical protein